MAKSKKIPTGDPELRLALLQDADVDEVVMTPEELKEMDHEIFGACRVANKYANQIVKDRIHGTINSGGIDSHSKMKIAQDYLTTAFLHPRIRQSFLKAIEKNPIAAAKLLVAMMPKDINVEVTQQQGVILVPMRMENVEDWEKKAIASLSGGEIIEGEAGEPRLKSWDDLIAEGK